MLPFQPRVVRTVIGTCFAAILAGTFLEAAAPPEAVRTLPQLQALVDTLRARLNIEQTVIAITVSRNALMASVRPPEHEQGPFQLIFDTDFLDSLTPAEIEAAVAHELGHVWIFTHFPFLQTEQLANDIAMRVVDRERLVSVYDKVWRRDGATHPDPTRYLSPDTGTGRSPATR